MAEVFDIDLKGYIAAHRLLDADSQKMQGALEAGVAAAANVVNRRAERQINLIYRGKIPTVAQVARHRNKSKKYRGKMGGRPAWKRTGTLKDGRNMDVSGLTAEITLSDAAKPYAARRHELGVTWQPKNPAMDITRKNPFFKEAVDKTEPQIEPTFKAAFAKELRR